MSRLLSLLQNLPDLQQELWKLLHQIPSGWVTTYGDLARALGDVKAARWVGEYLLAHPHAEGCPCHRVVRVNGDLGLYVSRDRAEKAALLESEGIPVRDGKVDLDQHCFDDLSSTSPLAALTQLQHDIPAQLRLEPLPSRPRLVGGVDVSYITRTEAVAAFVLLELPSQEHISTTIVRGDVNFPYISGYLSFRELPILLKLFEQMRTSGPLPDVTFVDGNGILHPRRAGSGACFGLAAGTPTIGVGKKLLCGRVENGGSSESEVSPVMYDGIPVGYAVRAGTKNRPFFVSPGHLTDLPTTLSATQLVLGDRRLPLPIALADRESRREAKGIKDRRKTGRQHREG